VDCQARAAAALYLYRAGHLPAAGGPLAILRTPTDIFPSIDIPVVSVVWTYNGLSAEDMAQRIVTGYERSLTNSVDDIEHIESQTLASVAVIKVFFHPGADINRAIAQPRPARSRCCAACRQAPRRRWY